jgi:peptide/nickel transport system permease protein
MSALSDKAPAAIIEATPAVSPWRRFVAEFAESKLAMAGLVLFAIMALAAILAPLIAPQDPYDLAQLDIFDVRLPPGSVSEGSGLTYWLGTDAQGRDMLSAILYGLRVSLAVGAVSVIVAMSLGLVVGLGSAYFGGRVDAVLMRLVDIQLGFPAILVALILLSVVGQGIDKVMIALIVVQWAYFARLARGAALAERHREYVEAATSLALPAWRIVFRHIMPNVLPPLIVYATVRIAEAVALEATLSFLGVGVPVTEPSLGLLLRNGFGFLLSGDYWISFFPGAALALAIIAINLVGDQLRDMLNPRLKR